MLDLDTPLHVLVKQLNDLRSVEPEAENEDPPFPKTFREFLPYFFLPHLEARDEQGVVAVCAWPLSPAQQKVVDEGSVIDFDATRPSTGRDIVGKGRRMFLTSLVYAWIVWCCLRYPGGKYMTVHQDTDRDTISSAMEQIMFALERLPKSWFGDEGFRRAGNQVHIGASIWSHRTAGHSEEVAAKIGIGQRLDGLHLTEAAKYPHPRITYTAAAKAARGGWIIAESTPRAGGGWFNDELGRSTRKRGLFRRAVFLPWYVAPLNRIRRDGPNAEDFEAAMSPEFEAQMDPEDLARERELRAQGLDDEQIAFRRQERCKGDEETRRKARAEYPESIADAETPAGKGWLHPEAVALALADCRPARLTAQYGALMEARYFVDPSAFRALNRNVVLAADTALFTGDDRGAAIAIDAETLEQLAVLHGREIDSLFAVHLRRMLVELLGESGWSRGLPPAHRYVLVIESNRGGGLIRECTELGLDLYTETVIRKGEHGAEERESRVGLRTDGRTRPAILAALSRAVQGPLWDVVRDRPVAPAPTVVYRDRATVEQIGGMRADKDGKIQAAPKKDGGKGHDDLAIASGLALYVAQMESTRALFAAPHISVSGRGWASPLPG